MALNQEFLNQNSQRNYPFHENVSLIPNEDPSLRLPNSLIVDCVMTVPGDLPRVYLSDLMLVGNHINIVFKDANDVIVSSISVNLGEYKIYNPLNLYGIGDYSDMRGKLILGYINDFKDKFNDGNYTFSIETTEMSPAVIRPSLRGVRWINLLNNEVQSENITGVVKLVAGTNIKLSYDTLNNQIKVDATSIPGTSFNEQCECEDDLVPEPIRTINGINTENIDIIGDGRCVEIEKSGNKLIIKDTCSYPCCGCEELEFLTDSLALLESNVVRLEEYRNILRSKLDEFVQTASISL